MTRTLKIAVIPGDGIGPEVSTEANKVLDAALTSSDIILERTEFKLGAERFLNTGEVLPEDEQAHIAEHDAILFGAVGGVPGDERLKDAGIERNLLLKLRFDFDQYVNLRPCKLYAGVSSSLAEPGNVDFVVVREGTEGPYAGNGGRLRAGTNNEIANEVSVNTAYGVEASRSICFQPRRIKTSKKAYVGRENQCARARGGLVAACSRISRI